LTTENKPLETWAVLEIMGHNKFAGLLSEQTIAGHGFVRIDVPEVELEGGTKLPAFTKMFGAASIYAISPCTEETARAFVKMYRAKAFSEYQAPRLTVKETDEDDEEDDEWCK
jgi:hypothetical protein